MKPERKIILLSVGAGTLAWSADALIDSIFFHDDTFLNLLLVNVTPFEIYIRSAMCLIFIVSGFIISKYFRKTEMAERAARETYAELNHIFNASVPLCVIDRDYNIVKANATFAALFGTDREEILGKKCHDVCSSTECGTSDCRMRRIIEGRQETVDFETEKQLLDGRKIPCIVHATPFRGEDGDLTGIVESITDISLRKEAEEKIRVLVDELIHKNEELENFALTVSHDLKAPLTLISNYVTMLNEKYEATGVVEKSFIQGINKGVFRMDRMIRDLLDYCFVSGENLEYEEITLGEIVEEAVADLDLSLKSGNLEVDIVEGETVLCGDRIRLVQAMQNLVGNAAKYMGEDNPSPRIEIGAQSGEGGEVFYVKDNGIGIRPEDLRKIFNIYHRLMDAENVEGSGVGLAIVKRIIENHGGEIRAESEYGKGATFIFTIKEKQSGA